MSSDLPTRARDALRDLHEQGRIRSPWRDGMRWTLPCTGLRGRYRRMVLVPMACPDPTDPATLGCLMALLREATGNPCVHVRPVWWGRKLDGWCVYEGHHGPWVAMGETEAEAVVAALEAVTCG